MHVKGHTEVKYFTLIQLKTDCKVSKIKAIASINLDLLAFYKLDVSQP